MDSKIVESSVERVRSQFGYIISYKSNLERLKMELYNLEATKNCLQFCVDKAKRNGEQVVDVQNFLQKVNDIVSEAKEEHININNDIQVKDEYCMKYFPNLLFRHQKSKKYLKMTQKIHEVLKEANIQKISYPTTTIGMDSKLSKPSTLKEIQKVLKDPNIYRIGLYGIDGVGKTTLVKELARQVEKDGSFDVVVMAEVTDSPDVENIQSQIASALGLGFEEETKEERADNLCQKIREKKSVLVILDDIWEKLDLAELGIPFGDDHKGCKLLLTSEYRNVLKYQMTSQKEFRLEVLSDEESWKLFEKIAGNDIQMKGINSIAEEVARCCNCLPLLVVVVAKALRKKPVSTWKDALNQLKGFNEKGIFQEVVCPLELSYHYLESDALKSLFLFITSFGPGYIHTGELFSCHWGVYGDSQYTLTKARNEFYNLINDLRASSLLLEDEIEYAKMHVAVRDMAKAIASRTHLTFEARKFTEMGQWDTDELQRTHYINLPSYNIEQLPEMLNCPELRLMTLRKSVGYLTIPDNFFSGMREVKVLNLHRMRFAPSPPPSLRLLTNLVSLNLYGCLLEDIVIIAELTSLEILTLERSEIEVLPEEIGRLVKLRMLNLTSCHKLKTIPANLLSSLTRLEELYMGNCNIQWEVEGEKSETKNSSLSELRNLNQLTTLDLSIKDASVLPAKVFVSQKLQRYNIFIGSMWKWNSLWSGDAREISRTLKLADSLNTNLCSDSRIQLLFTAVEDLTLAKLSCVEDVSCELNGKRFPELRHLHIQNSDAFCNLETLILRDLYNMEDISYCPVLKQSFEKLKVIKVIGCYRLKKLLLCSLAKNLSQLQEMEISLCSDMEVIIFKENLEDEVILYKLHSLTLDGLSMLHSFSFCQTGDKDNQSTPVPLFNQKVTMPNLQTLELCSINTHKIWDDQQPLDSCIENLTSLKIDWCCSLTNLFTSSVARALVKLRYLRISNCPQFKNIFVQAEEATFSNLETLVISDDENLTSIWPNQIAPNSFCKLKDLEIHGAKILDHIFPISVVEDLRQLQVLKISRCRIMNIIERTDSPDHDKKHAYIEKLDVAWCYKLETVVSSVFPNLDELKVDNCGMVNIIKLSVASSLQNLRFISISSCTMLVEIIGSDNKSKAPREIITLTRLEELELKNLPRLTSFCRRSYNFNLPSLKKVRVINCSLAVSFCHGNLGTPVADTRMQHGLSTKDSHWYRDQDNRLVPLALFNEKVAMPKLETLELSYLDARKIWDGELPTHFYGRNFNLTVNDCHSLESLFSSSSVRALDKLQHLHIIRCDQLVEIFVGAEEITFPDLETLLINKVRILKSIWQNQQAPNSFRKLKKIEITECDALLYVFPIVVAKDLRQLQMLKISKSKIENIVKDQSDNQDVESIYLEKLIVHDCDRLETILQSSMLFQTLYELEVSSCGKVINIMETLIVTNLQNLSILNISKCPMLEQAVGKKKEGDELGEFTITKLEKLELKELPRFTHFCKESYNFNFPSLRSIHASGCPKMKTFLGETGQKDNKKLSSVSVASALFNEKVAIPNLEILELKDIGSQKIWDDKLPVHFYSPNLRILTVNNCYHVLSLFSSLAARALAKLQHLEIRFCPYLVEIFVQQEHVTFPNLETLHITFMRGLKSIWNNQQAPNSFCELKIMKIFSCAALHHVLPIVVAKELPQLQELKISSCSNIENIVEDAHSQDAQDEVASTKLDEPKFGIENKGDALGDVASMNLGESKYKAGELSETIVFMKLEKLELEMLPKLTNFCKASYNFNFPALQIIHVVNCFQMKTFCNGNVITPSLSKVQFGRKEYSLDGDLNTTLERYAKENFTLSSRREFISYFPLS